MPAGWGSPTGLDGGLQLRPGHAQRPFPSGPHGRRTVDRCLAVRSRPVHQRHHPPRLVGQRADLDTLRQPSPYKPAAPHGVYPCAGEDRWITIACFTEDEWRALTRVAGHPEWANDQRFGDLAARLAHQDALDALVGGWTQTLDAYQAMYSLQQAGVPAGVCQTAEDRCDHDPQLAALNWLTR